jgi:3-deoxy-D-manno-octulosonic-acid transferase
MSDKSMKKAQRLAWLSRPAFAALTAVWAQTPADADRLIRLGARVQGVFGNLKFDAQPNASQLALGRSWRSKVGRPVILFASSREGEEASLLASVLAGFDQGSAQWLIVPRHPQRFAEVAALIEQYGFAVSRRSTWGDAAPVAGKDPARSTIWLGDSLGEMALYYGLSDLALLGGSFAPLGGQNLIEAAACACPVLMGPHTFNFAEAAALAEVAGAAQRVSSLQQALELVSTLTANPSARVAMQCAATEFSGAHRGALEKTVAAVLALLDQQGVDAL